MIEITGINVDSFSRNQRLIIEKVKFELKSCNPDIITTTQQSTQKATHKHLTTATKDGLVVKHSNSSIKSMKFYMDRKGCLRLTYKKGAKAKVLVVIKTKEGHSHTWKDTTRGYSKKTVAIKVPASSYMIEITGINVDSFSRNQRLIIEKVKFELKSCNPDIITTTQQSTEKATHKHLTTTTTTKVFGLSVPSTLQITIIIYINSYTITLNISDLSCDFHNKLCGWTFDKQNVMQSSKYGLVVKNSNSPIKSMKFFMDRKGCLRLTYKKGPQAKVLVSIKTKDGHFHTWKDTTRGYSKKTVRIEVSSTSNMIEIIGINVDSFIRKQRLIIEKVKFELKSCNPGTTLAVKPKKTTGIVNILYRINRNALECFKPTHITFDNNDGMYNQHIEPGAPKFLVDALDLSCDFHNKLCGWTFDKQNVMQSSKYGLVVKHNNSSIKSMKFLMDRKGCLRLTYKKGPQAKVLVSIKTKDGHFHTWKDTSRGFSKKTVSIEVPSTSNMIEIIGINVDSFVRKQRLIIEKVKFELKSCNPDGLVVKNSNSPIKSMKFYIDRKGCLKLTYKKGAKAKVLVLIKTKEGHTHTWKDTTRGYSKKTVAIEVPASSYMIEITGINVDSFSRNQRLIIEKVKFELKSCNPDGLVVKNSNSPIKSMKFYMDRKGCLRLTYKKGPQAKVLVSVKTKEGHSHTWKDTTRGYSKKTVAIEVPASSYMIEIIGINVDSFIRKQRLIIEKVKFELKSCNPGIITTTQQSTQKATHKHLTTTTTTKGTTLAVKTKETSGTTLKTSTIKPPDLSCDFHNNLCGWTFDKTNVMQSSKYGLVVKNSNSPVKSMKFYMDRTGCLRLTYKKGPQAKVLVSIKTKEGDSHTWKDTTRSYSKKTVAIEVPASSNMIEIIGINVDSFSRNQRLIIEKVNFELKSCNPGTTLAVKTKETSDGLVVKNSNSPIKSMKFFMDRKGCLRLTYKKGPQAKVLVSIKTKEGHSYTWKDTTRGYSKKTVAMEVPASSNMIEIIGINVDSFSRNQRLIIEKVNFELKSCNPGNV
ncbi:hypothetical protein GQR58_023532 [Nymphon striatum]|nr:hypothetical protein GQR58_023532 [Nymphon striatum]